ncbi:hypothetical protein B0H10DRAFT_2438618 [Mycena sp. CBHHK59/15]|nr:hypothetical protein B0H10DRAFT_2438618 [Mycena sp. CBHHK59/15]
MLPHHTQTARPGPHPPDHNHPLLPSIRQLHPYLPPMAPTPPPPPPPPPDPPAHAPPSDDDQDSPQADGQPPRKRRRRQPLSCTECKRRKIRCDRNQPCAPCVRRGDQSKCQWHAIEPATEKYVPLAEHDALRVRVEALEALVHRPQVPSPPALALSQAHPLPPTFSHPPIPFSPHPHPPAPPLFSSGPASFGSGSGSASASFGTTSSSGSGSTSTSTSASTSFANHASTSQATQHPDLLDQALRSHSPVSPSALVGRHVQDVGPGRSAPLPGRAPARSRRALGGAAVSPTEYSLSAYPSASYPASSGYPGGQGDGGGGREGRDAREEGRGEHGTLRVDVNMHPSPPLSLASPPGYQQQVYLPPAHAASPHPHAQGYPPHMFRRSSFGGGGELSLSRRPSTGSGASRHIIGDASLAERRASYSAPGEAPLLLRRPSTSGGEDQLQRRASVGALLSLSPPAEGWAGEGRGRGREC